MSSDFCFVKIFDDCMCCLLDDDFASNSDLFIACTILQKQIEHIDGKKANIVIPSVQMKNIRDQIRREQSGMQQVLSHEHFLYLYSKNSRE